MKSLQAIDLFAGAGGFSTGAAQAGARVILAANHWPVAVATHLANHPGTRHACQDLRQADWSDLPDHDLLLASPCCQGHSRARGKDSAQHDDSRQTAWAVVDCVAVKRPKFFVVENVAEFLGWELFDLWKTALVRYGYRLTFNLLNAADFGVPQSRERLFIVGSLGKQVRVHSPERRHVAASTIIDWDSGSWSKVRQARRSANTLARIAAARAKYGDRCMVAYYGGENGGRDLSKPLGTVTTRDRFALVDGDRMRMLTVDEYRQAMGFPKDYILPPARKTAIHLLGNAVVPAVAAHVVRAIQEAA